MIRHIFSDMDGTLLDGTGRVAAATVAAIKAADIPTTLVSARAPLEMAPAIEALGLTEPQVGFNGGLIYRKQGDSWETIEAHPIASNTARLLINDLIATYPELSVSYYDKSRWLAPRIDDGVAFEAKLTEQSPVITTTDEVFADEETQIFKIMLITFDEDLMTRVAHDIAARGIEGVSVQRSGQAYLEITSAEAKKSRGIRYILNREGIDASETAGFGDGHNDLPMLEIVGFPVVMANAADEIKQIAGYVTKSNREDGVAYALTHCPEFK